MREREREREGERQEGKCDRICENMSNYRFNNYVLAAVLSPYIILSLLLIQCFYIVMNDDDVGRLGKFETSILFRSSLTAVRKCVPRTCDTRKRSKILTLCGYNRIIFGLP